MNTAIRASFQGIFEEELMVAIEEVAQIKTFEAGAILIDFGATIRAIPLLLSGVIKIMREDIDQGELLLYYLEKGDSCAVSMDCCMGQKISSIRARADSTTTVAFIPTYYLDEWMGKYKSWRNFILSSYSNRFNELLGALDSVAFLPMEERILNYLREKQKVAESNVLQVTHQEIANDLNSSRVVVSRLLKSLEKQGYLLLQRNNIQINNVL
ncbi:Crp/Fnr family transcriptional regulator [Sphingobacteriaceae bacterium WQ 2009]|uniref:Crp/Fnr family transcriptional regulator n=1 Tax=Rhinopithecimicrobium faecis TaxID=2820698 RepID=A0A8T4H532_9SPHI|nr:Crp/Fnr family transcriptional regulator [Sphingobacteriaceae bacterium WQ 2009]